jgi:hypothetical protein
MSSIGNRTITGVADQIGNITGRVSAENSIRGSISSGASLTGHMAIGTVIEAALSTFIIVDENNNEIAAVLVDEEVAVTAGPNDIRIGETAITGDGIIIGEKEIPRYRTAEGYRLVMPDAQFIIPHEDYDYEKLQAVVCGFNMTVAMSVKAIKVVLENKVYDVNSIAPLSLALKDHANSLVDLGIVNDTGEMCVIRYFMFKEVL